MRHAWELRGLPGVALFVAELRGGPVEADEGHGLTGQGKGEAEFTGVRLEPVGRGEELELAGGFELLELCGRGVLG